MSIKSDRWIRRMAQEHGMIEPFEPGRVKMVDGKPIVSYGTSSYGYDIRCSSEFKLFTDINCTIVDPKNFDPISFVEVKGEHCIIPPNSFALARTHEPDIPPAQRFSGKLSDCRELLADVSTGMGHGDLLNFMRCQEREQSLGMKMGEFGYEDVNGLCQERTEVFRLAEVG